MPKTDKPYANLWDYLEHTGVLDWGTDEDIKRAKKEYKKIYHRGYMRERRKANRHVTIPFSKTELSILIEAAKRHNESLPQFIKASGLAYHHNRYLVPNEQQVVRLEQILSLIYNQIQEMTSQGHKMGCIDLYHMYIAVTQQLKRVEHIIGESLRDPKNLQTHIQEAIAQDPNWTTWLRTQLS